MRFVLFRFQYVYIDFSIPNKQKKHNTCVLSNTKYIQKLTTQSEENQLEQQESINLFSFDLKEKSKLAFLKSQQPQERKVEKNKTNTWLIHIISYSQSKHKHHKHTHIYNKKRIRRRIKNIILSRYQRHHRHRSRNTNNSNSNEGKKSKQTKISGVQQHEKGEENKK